MINMHVYQSLRRNKEGELQQVTVVTKFKKHEWPRVVEQLDRLKVYPEVEKIMR